MIQSTIAWHAIRAIDIMLLVCYNASPTKRKKKKDRKKVKEVEKKENDDEDEEQ